MGSSATVPAGLPPQTPAVGFRPSQWTQGTTATLTLLVPSQSNIGDNLPLNAASAQPTLYVFDGVLRASHEQDGVATQNPVQTGASLTDHFYLLPARLSVEILMSDTMQSYVAGQFSGNASRSVSAYQALLAIQDLKVPFAVATRLRQYSNMLITSIRPDEESATRFALRCSVTFQQILTATVDFSNTPASASSARPDATVNTQAGTTPAQPVPQAVTQQHFAFPLVGAQTPPAVTAPTVPSAGNWSSTNTAPLDYLRKLPPP